MAKISLMLHNDLLSVLEVLTAATVMSAVVHTQADTSEKNIASIIKVEG
jgi:hypothetical protein